MCVCNVCVIPLHLPDAGRSPGCVWRPPPGQSGPSPTPARWTRSPVSSSAPGGYATPPRSYSVMEGGRGREGEKKESVWSNRFIHAVLWGGVTVVYIAKIIPVLGRYEHTCTHAETHMDEVNSGRISGRDKRQEGSGDERIVRDNDRGRSAVLSCICPLGLLLSSEPRVLNPSFESWPTAELVHTHTHAHTGACTQCWQSGLGNSLRTPRQPDTLPNTTLTHTHICTSTHRTLSLWAAGCLALAPEMAGRYFARVCFSILRKGTQTRAWQRQPSSTATETQAIC